MTSTSPTRRSAWPRSTGTTSSSTPRPTRPSTPPRPTRRRPSPSTRSAPPTSPGRCRAGRRPPRAHLDRLRLRRHGHRAVCRRPPRRAALGLRPHQGRRRVGRARPVPRVVGRAHGVALRRRRAELRLDDAAARRRARDPRRSSTTRWASRRGPSTSPTSSSRLVAADAPAGIYHGTSSGDDVARLARAVFEESGLDPGRVERTTTSETADPQRDPPGARRPGTRAAACRRSYAYWRLARGSPHIFSADDGVRPQHTLQRIQPNSPAKPQGDARARPGAPAPRRRFDQTHPRASNGGQNGRDVTTRTPAAQNAGQHTDRREPLHLPLWLRVTTTPL